MVAVSKPLPRAFLTPDNEPGVTRCRAIVYPDGVDYDALVIGALSELARVENWQQHGAQTPEDTANAFLDMLWGLSPGMGGCMYVGSIFFSAAIIEDPNIIPCDGRAIRRDDYAALFAAIGTVFGAPGGDHFNVPNLERYFVIGASHGDNGGVPELGDTGGDDTVTLVTSNLPSHNHGVHGHTAALVLGPGEIPVSAPSLIGGSTDHTGSGAPVDIMPPYVGLLAYIVAR